MYCKKHQSVISGCGIDITECQQCDMEFESLGTPPVDKYCKDCSEKFGICQLCGDPLPKKEN